MRYGFIVLEHSPHDGPQGPLIVSDWIESRERAERVRNALTADSYGLEGWRYTIARVSPA